MVDNYKKQINGIMSRELSRGDFLKVVGVSMLSLVGFVGFIKNLHHATNGDKRKSSGGYGGSAYGS